MGCRVTRAPERHRAYTWNVPDTTTFTYRELLATAPTMEVPGLVTKSTLRPSCP